jgi:hypothetical protein
VAYGAETYRSMRAPERKTTTTDKLETSNTVEAYSGIYRRDTFGSRTA